MKSFGICVKKCYSSEAFILTQCFKMLFVFIFSMLYHVEAKNIFRLMRSQENLRNRLKNNVSLLNSYLREFEQKFVEQLAHGTSTKQDASKAKRMMSSLQGFLNNMKINAKKIDLLFFHKLNDYTS